MQFLDPRNDVAFKKIFGSEAHKQVTISFLNSILEKTGSRAIAEIQFLNTEQKRIIRNKKDNILDILCTDQSCNRYIVEMQVDRVKAFDKRMVYYGAKTYAMQLNKKQSYIKLAPVVVVAILDFVMFPHKKNYKSIHKFFDDKTFEQDLGELTFAFVELTKFSKKENELVSAEDKWLYFIKQISKEDHIPASLAQGEFEDACHVAERMAWSEEELNDYDDAIVRATDAQGALELAIEEGLAKGEAKGEARGEAKGEEKKAIKIARNMLNAGIDVATIAKTTDLSIETIEELANN